ncbi:uncharacterized protein B0H18DRAFT_1125738 [Fomitopsis serialis]|uniref:uncharacterized protein n=1 Tax=Fomitopsis serialis TaxID=139415 RepID=UPI002008C6FE|nr:uncharacterized protein B0H18DRAFT_1125738 [Neoantrodia serialis]KAH9914261.1 hypothetical protein B0H18DRAFT_1125738 [Neoantrodia serialis]
MSAAAKRPRASRVGRISKIDQDSSHEDMVDEPPVEAHRPARVTAQAAHTKWAQIVPKPRRDVSSLQTAGERQTASKKSTTAKKKQPAGEVSLSKAAQVKRKRADSSAAKVNSSSGGGRNTAPQDVVPSRSLNTDSHKETERSSKKLKVAGASGALSKPTQKKVYRAARIDVDRSDSEPADESRLASQAMSQSSKAITSARPAHSMSVSHLAEDALDEDGEEGDVDDELQEGAEDDEEAEHREVCDDFDAESLKYNMSQRVTFTAAGEHSTFKWRTVSQSGLCGVPLCSDTGIGNRHADNIGTMNELEAEGPPRFRSRGSRSSSVGSYPTEPPTTDDTDVVMDEEVESEDDDVNPPSRNNNTSSYAVSRGAAKYIKDSDDDSDVVDETGPALAQTVSKKLTKKQQEKLKSEMPIIRPSASKIKVAKHHRHTGREDDDDRWMPRTCIVINCKSRSVTMDIKPQSALMEQVIHNSYTVGDRMMAFGFEDPVDYASFDDLQEMTNPMDKAGLEDIALEALISASDKLGYTGQGDVSERLEKGSYSDYVKPLTAYVSHRLGLFRTAIKRAVTPSVEHAYQSMSQTAGNHDVPGGDALLQNMNYIYPWTLSDGFDRRSLYENSLVKPAVHAAFFMHMQYLGTGLQNGGTYASSLSSAPSEYEIPLTMMALAMTAVESVISDRKLGLSKASDFSATSAPAYQAHMMQLTAFRLERPKRYHRVMHDVFAAVTVGHAMHPGMHPGNAAKIDWSDIPDE